jgi:hypothetical protein
LIHVKSLNPYKNNHNNITEYNSPPPSRIEAFLLVSFNIMDNALRLSQFFS